MKSVITAPQDGAAVRAGDAIEIKGVAFDAGVGIKEVYVSVDAGATWHEAQLGKDLGTYAWRIWRYTFRPAQKGTYRIASRAVNVRGESQPLDPAWMPQGYMYNAVDAIDINVA